MKVFLSWSGDYSKQIASILKQWLPMVIQAIKPFYSTEDIGKGKRWTGELADQLEQSDFGIIILTPDNLTSPYIHFEAGALSKNKQIGRVSTLLFNLKDTDVESPLSEFQNTKFNRDDVLSLLKDINALLDGSKLDDSVLSNIFDKMWTDLETKVASIQVSNSAEIVSQRSERDMIEEVLNHTRSLVEIASTTSNAIDRRTRSASLLVDPRLNDEPFDPRGYLEENIMLTEYNNTFIRLGSNVEHPVYGIGQVLSLSTTNRATYAVILFEDKRRRKFDLSKTDLRVID